MSVGYATIDMGLAQPWQDKLYESAIGPQRLGWYTWSYGTHESKIYPINFRQQIVFPPDPDVQGLNIYTDSRNNWTAKLYGVDGAGLGITTTGGAVNPTDGTTTGLNAIGAFFGQVAKATTPFQVTLPWGQANHKFAAVPTTTDEAEYGDNPAPKYNYKMYLVMLQFACEIAQWTVLRAQNSDTQVFASRSGWNYIPAPAGVLRWIELDLTARPTLSSQLFGDTGLYKVGYVAFEYNGYISEMRYVNQIKQHFFPEAPGATGMYYWLFPPVAANITLAYLSAIAEAISTTLGDISFLAGRTAGMSQ